MCCEGKIRPLNGARFLLFSVIVVLSECNKHCKTKELPIATTLVYSLSTMAWTWSHTQGLSLATILLTISYYKIRVLS